MLHQPDCSGRAYGFVLPWDRKLVNIVGLMKWCFQALSRCKLHTTKLQDSK
jgi:hypothetical protein